MSFLTIQARFKFATLFGLLLLVGCASTPKPPVLPQMTQLQIRTMQTREYSGADEKRVLKSLMSALLDEGFIINAADQSLGLITATKELYAVDEATKSLAEFNRGSGSGTYQTTIRSEASGLVRPFGDVVQVRISIVQKSVSNAGGNIWSQPLYDPVVYQTIFSKVDKAVFLEKENL